MAKRKRKKRKLALWIIGILIIILSLILFSYLKQNKVNLSVDENAIKENDANIDKMEITPGGGAVSLQYSKQLVINNITKEISMYLKNPSKSRENISFEIYLKENGEDKIIGATKLIPTGYSIRKLQLTEDNIENGNYKGYIKVFFYNEETNEKEILDTKINIEIQVK